VGGVKKKEPEGTIGRRIDAPGCGPVNFKYKGNKGPFDRQRKARRGVAKDPQNGGVGLLHMQKATWPRLGTDQGSGQQAN